MDSTTQANRMAWEAASRKHVREYGDLLAQAASGPSLTGTERDLLREILRCSPEVVHLQSGHGLDDVALVQAGARSVVGIDYSEVAVRAAQRRADELGAACRYAAAAIPGAPLASASADLVYTGKGALIWMPDLTAWARDVARLLRPSGHLFIYEAHPAVILWTWDQDRPRIREDRSYFARSHVNDTFPARGAVEWQWTLGQVVTAVAAAGLEILHLGEYPEPFWRAGGVSAAAWSGRLPNSFALLARRAQRTAAPGAGSSLKALICRCGRALTVTGVEHRGQTCLAGRVQGVGQKRDGSEATAIFRVAEAEIGRDLRQQVQALLRACFPGYPSRSYFKLPPHFRYLAMTSGVLAAQMGVEFRVIRVGSTVLRTFGVVDLCVRTSERSHGLAGRLLAEVTELARSCGVDFVILFADDDRLYTRGGWARAANPCSWVKIHDHTTLGLATAEDTGSLMVKRIGQQAWPIGEVDLLGHLF